MTRFLGISRISEGAVELHWTLSPVEVLAEPGGRVSPVFPLVPTAARDLPASGVIAILFPDSPRSALSWIQHRAEEGVRAATYFTHGLGAVVVFTDGDVASLDSLIAALKPSLHAMETWPYSERRLVTASVDVWRPSHTPVEAFRFSRGALPLVVEAEVQELELNLTMFRSRAIEAAPELVELPETISRITQLQLEELEMHLAAPGLTSSSELQETHNAVTVFADLNSCLTLANSQFAASASPTLLAGMSVGRYSLFGIGSAVRALWRVYAHMAHRFSEVDHNGHIKAAWREPGFAPAYDVDQLHTATWGAIRESAFGAAIAEPEPNPRRHVIYFSSRWGFHETLNSISVSWQSIRAGATPEWNLLTLSHEFLHSLFREVVHSAIFGLDDQKSLAQLLTDYNRAVVDESEPNRTGAAVPQLRRAMQFQLINELQFAGLAQQYLAEAEAGPFVAATITEDDFKTLVSRPLMDVLEEYVVHILDFHYFYNTDDETYVRSLWHSWATVPAVRPKIEHYVVRTLLALSSIDKSDDPLDAFDNAMGRLRAALDGAASATSNSLVHQARSVAFGGTSTQKRLYVAFKANRGLVRFVREFLVDDGLYGLLSADELASSDTERAYPWEPNDFPERGPESPTAFLLDRFKSSETIDVETGCESLWQLLMVT